MSIQNLFYIGGIIAFVLSSILLAILIFASLGLTKKAKNLLETLEDSMEGNVVSTIIQLVPLMAAIFTEVTNRKPVKRKRRKKRK